MSPTLLNELLQASIETIWMVVFSGLIAALLGIPVAVLLLTTRPGGLLQNAMVYRGLSLLVNIARSIPFIILMIAIIPMTRFLVGTSIGTAAAIVPLSLAAIPFVARVVEGALLEVPSGLQETGMVFGASVWQIIYKIILPEALPGIINALTITMITLVGYSAMAGAVGAGGLGNLAINYGYQRFDIQVMIWTIVVLVVMVQIIQMIGDRLARYFQHEG